MWTRQERAKAFARNVFVRVRLGGDPRSEEAVDRKPTEKALRPIACAGSSRNCADRLQIGGGVGLLLHGMVYSNKYNRNRVK